MAYNTMNMNMSIPMTPMNSPNHLNENGIGKFKGLSLSPTLVGQTGFAPLTRPTRVGLNENYPVSGSIGINEKINAENLSRKSKKETTKFIVATSYDDACWYSSSLLKEKRTQFISDDSRSKAFAKMENKEEIAKNLTGTKTCKNIQLTSTGEFGVCYREKCTFAHSLEELNDPMCGFDDTCRHRLGKVQRDGTVDKTRKCMFRHSIETRDEWAKRTDRVIPNLPKTSEKTRKPVARTDMITVIKPQNTTPTLNVSMANSPVLTGIPITPITSVWGIKVPVPVPVLIALDKAVNNTRKSVEYDSDKYRSRSRSPRHSSHRSRYSSRRVIRVPNNHLAELAINAALDRGIYNLQVIID